MKVLRFISRRLFRGKVYRSVYETQLRASDEFRFKCATAYTEQGAGQAVSGKNEAGSFQPRSYYTRSVQGQDGLLESILTSAYCEL